LFQSKMDLIATWIAQVVNLIVLGASFLLDKAEEDTDFSGSEDEETVELVLLILIFLSLLIALVRAIYKMIFFWKHKDKNTYEGSMNNYMAGNGKENM